MANLGNIFQDLLLAEQLMAELEAIKQMNVGDTQALPVIKGVKVNHNNYELDITVKRNS